MSDVEMDAPQISTLRDDSEPPQVPAPRRVKLLVGKSGGSSSSRSTSNKPVPQEEEEEDQLIDDEEPAEGVSAGPSPAKKPKITLKKRASKPKVEAPPEPVLSATQPESSPVKIAPKKKASPKKPSVQPDQPPTQSPTPTQPVVPKPRKAPTKHTKAMFSQLLVEDPGAASETYTGTVASSPPPHHDAYSPEPPVFHNTMSVAYPDLGGPAPIYPLPAKPFPVQSSVKVVTGVASLPPLDKSGAKVRRWRVAHREIRGIAGGRWFARSWTGEKEPSEFSSVLPPPSVLPPLKFVTVEASTAAKAPKPKLAAKPVVPPPNSAGSTSAVVPTKMRDSVAAPSSDVDMQ